MIDNDGDVPFNRQTNRKSDLKVIPQVKTSTTSFWAFIILFPLWCDKHSFPRNLAELWKFWCHPDRSPCKVDNRLWLWWTSGQAAGSETRGAPACDEAEEAMAVECCTSSTNTWNISMLLWSPYLAAFVFMPRWWMQSQIMNANFWEI